MESGTIYHVTARVNRKERLLQTPKSKTLFLETLIKLRKKYSCRIDNFVIMDNHVHLLVEPIGGTTLPEMMKWLLGVYTMKYNRMFNTSGHFWGDRYYSVPLKNFEEYIHAFLYINQNPVRARIVEKAIEWEWGGLWQYHAQYRDIVDEVPPWLALAYIWGLSPDIS